MVIVDRFAQRLALHLRSEGQRCSSTAKHGGSSAGVKVVGTHDIADRRRLLNVAVALDSPGQYQHSRCIDFMLSFG